MKRLHVLFDANCAMCRRCRQWLEAQPAFFELTFVPLQSSDLAARFPGIESIGLRDELVAVGDDGSVYRGARAWIMCFYALREYRAWSFRLAHPALLPFARKVCAMVSENRMGISRWFMDGSPMNAGRTVETAWEEGCDETGTCHV